jgi:putative tryptophan/tyrosine transport system substrate-binding protein
MKREAHAPLGRPIVQQIAFVICALTMLLPATAHRAKAQPLKTLAVVCHCRSDFTTYKSFEAGLTELGLRNGETARILKWFSDGDPARLARNAQEAVASNPDVIFAGFTPAVIALQKLTTTIPIAFAGVSDASDIDAANYLNRPNHNFTGPITINRELMPKRLELLKEALPSVKVVGYVANPLYGLHTAQLREMEEAAQRLGVRLEVAEVTAASQLDQVFAELVAKGAQALVVQQDPLLTGQSAKIVGLAEANRLPAIYALRNFFDAGGLMWYGADIPAQFRRAADYVDKMLKGARPADLPVERPVKVHLAVNTQLAKRLGVEISPGVLARADEVIE